MTNAHTTLADQIRREATSCTPAQGKALKATADLIEAAPGYKTGNMAVHMAYNLCFHAGCLDAGLRDAFTAYVRKYGKRPYEIYATDLVAHFGHLYTAARWTQYRVVKLARIDGNEVIEVPFDDERHFLVVG